MYVASPEIQRTLYVESGGQPGHRTAWVDSGANELSCSYFADTLPGLEAGYLRPRYDGALLVQNKGRDVLWDFLGTGGEPNDSCSTRSMSSTGGRDMQASANGPLPERAVSRGPWAAIELANEDLSVTLLPEKGCDILELSTAARGSTSCLRRPGGTGGGPSTPRSSFEAWIESYPGGWQVLLPNGGDAAVENGAEWGFHGEAGVVEWKVDEVDLKPPSARRR